MAPDILGFHNSSYTLCLILGILVAFIIAIIFLKKNGVNKDGIIDLLICACFAIASAIVFAVVFENLYELIKVGKDYVWNWGKMTFFGGLFGGVVGFLLTYFFIRKNRNFDIKNVLPIAPVSIAIAHSIGRIGCFLAGCCYGKPTDSWIGVDFPGIGKRVPTQLIESIFLFILFAVMLVLFLKKDFKYNFVIYAGAYGIFRFIIEFFRGDERGVLFALSPSQIWSILLIVGSIPLYFLLRHVYEKK